MIQDLSKIQDNQLLQNFSQVVQREREVISDLIIHLAELTKGSFMQRRLIHPCFLTSQKNIIILQGLLIEEFRRRDFIKDFQKS